MSLRAATLLPARMEESLVIPFPGTERKEDIGWANQGIRNRLGRELPETTHDRHIQLSFLAYRTISIAHKACIHTLKAE